jgi:phosphoribosylanthranilate isomerase
MIFASKLGVWGLGFIFVPKSPRVIDITMAKEMTKILNIYYPDVLKVGVFANSTEEFIKEVVSICDLDAIQFHGEEPPDFTKKFHKTKFKAFIADDRSSFFRLIDDINRYDDCLPLLDLPKDRNIPWNILLEMAYRLKETGRDFILAGGIGIGNIKDVVDLDPYGIDIARGAEISPGIKDREKLEKIVDIVKKEGREYV